MRWLVRVYIFRSREGKGKDIFRVWGACVIRVELQKRIEKAEVIP